MSSYKSFQPKKEKKMAKKTAVFVAVSLLIVFTVFPPAFKEFSSRANGISIPFWIAGDGISSGISGVFSLFRSKRFLSEQNRALASEISELKQQLSGYDFVVAENLEMRDLLFQRSEKRIFARIISRPNVTAYDTFLIDVGKSAGVGKGAVVLAQKNSVIGLVEEAYPDSSKARLFSTAGTITNIFLGPENIPAELHGMGGGSFFAEIPKDIDIREGDTAILAEKPEYIAAYVVSEEKDSTQSFQKFYLKSPVGLFTIKYVEIEKQ